MGHEEVQVSHASGAGLTFEFYEEEQKWLVLANFSL